MKKLILTILVSTALTNIIAQNLIPNYSFEDLTSCPANGSEIEFAPPWVSPTVGSPDLFNSCAPFPVGVPLNVFGDQNAATGDGYAGFFSAVNGQVDEYVMVPLAEPLEAGACYYGEVYINRSGAIDEVALSGLGMYLTDGPPPLTGFEIFANPPQIYTNEPVSDTENWTQISGIFIADGTEDHVSVGHFLPDSETATQYLVSNPIIFGSYYYVDDVTLIKLDANSTVDFTICDGDCVSFGNEEFCEEGTFSFPLTGCGGGAGNITLNITVTPIPEVEIAPITLIDCNNTSTTLDASGSTGLPLANSYGWTGPDGSTSSETIIEVTNPGWHTFTVFSGPGCIAKDSIEVLANYDVPDLSIDPPSAWDCVAPTIALTGSSTTANVTYLWVGPGINEASSTVDINQPGTYELTITGPNGCTETGQIDFPLDYFTIPEANINPVEVLSCNNTIVNLEGSTNLADPSFLWTGPGLSESTSNAQTSQPGIFSFTVTSVAGCSTTNTVEVLENVIEPDALAFVTIPVDCDFGFITLEGTTSNGNPAYNWEGPGILESNELIEAYEPGIYTFTVTDQDNGCTATAELTLTEEDFSIPNFIIIDPVEVINCNNFGVTLYGSTDAIDPTYLWVGPGLNDPNQTSFTDTPGTYTLIVNNANGCELEESIEVTGSLIPPDLLITGIENLDCNNTSTTLVGSSSFPNVTYTWESPTEIFENDSILVNTPGTYILEVINTDNQCSATEQVEIFADPNVPTSDAGADGVLDCNAVSYNLDGSNSQGDDLTYQWFDSNDNEVGNAEIITVTTSDVYTLLITNGTNGCTSIDQVEVTQDASVPTSDAGLDGVLDCTAASYDLDGSNSLGEDLIYQWFDSNDIEVGNSDIITVTTSDVYTLLITNGTNGCTSMDEVEVTQDASVPTSNAGLDGVLDCTNASYDLDGSNSLGYDLTYQWFDSNDNEIGNGEVITVTTSDVYTLLITNGTNGCTSIDEVEVTQDASVPSSDAGLDGVLDCTNASYDLDGSNSLGDNLTYQWFDSDDNEVGNTELITVTISDVYTLLITNGTNGCTSIDQVEVTQDASVPTSNAGLDGVLDCTNESYDLDGSNSMGDDLTYQWFDSNDNEIGNGEVITVTTSDVYTLLITNGTNGCTSIDQVEVTQDASVPTSDAGLDGVLDCTAATYDLDGSNSLGDNLTYQWFDSNDNEVGNAGIITVTTSDVYILLITNGTNGCTSIDQVEVTQDASVPTSDAGLDGVLDCTNASYDLDGSNSLGDDLTYQWFDSNDNEVGNTELITVTTSDVYTLLITNGTNGCTSIDQVEVTQDASVPTSDAGLDGVLDCTAATYDLNGSNSIGDDLTYQWFDSNDNEVGNTELITVTTSDVYTLLITNGTNGCTSIDQVEVTQDASVPSSNAGLDGVLDCTNASYDLDGSNSLGDDLTYQWFDSNDNEVGNTELITVTTSDVYTLLITNGTNGCTSIDQVEVTQDASVPSSDAGLDGVLDCTAATYDLDGSNSLGDDLTYQWFDSNDNEIGNTELITVTTSDVYTLLITNGTNGCTSIDEVEVTQDASVPSSNAGLDGVLDCTNASYDLDGSNSLGDNLIYQWFDSNDNEVGNTELITVTTSDVYTLLITNGTNGCTSIDQVEVSQDASVPSSDAGLDGVLDCTNTSYNLNGSSSSNGNLTYSWLNSDEVEIGTSETLEVSIAETYTLIVTNQTNGCTSTDEVTVTQDITSPTANAGADGIITCLDEDFLLDASNSTGNNLSYEWYSSAGVLISSNITFTVLSPDDYTLVVTNTVNGCTATDELSVFENTVSPLAAAVVNGILTCEEEEVTLSGSASSGTDIEFAWFNQNNQLISNEENVVVSTAGNYNLIITDLVNGCQQTDVVSVLEDVVSPLAVATTLTNLTCDETEAALVNGQGSSSGANFLYEWAGPGTIQNSSEIEAAVNLEGLYVLQVTNTINGCTATAQTEVIQSADFPGTPELTVLGPNCNGGEATLIISEVTGGSPPYLYSINGGDSFESGNLFTDLTSGSYDVLIEDSEGCLYEEYLVVEESNELLIDLQPTLTVEYGNAQQLNAMVNIAPSQIASVEWTPAVGLSCTGCLSPNIAFATQTIRYAVLVTDVNGCQAKAEIRIEVNKNQDIYIPTAFSPNADNINDDFMIYSAENTIREINFIRIFDRWGALVFEGFRGQANDPTFSWDGTKGGERLNAGVFAYVAEVILNDGSIKILKGDITLME